MSLQAAHQLLGWPEPARILSPAGAGPAVLAQLAKQKLENAIRGLAGCQSAKVGVLVDNPEGKSSHAPLAVVAEFNRPIPDSALREIHRLGWNFARSPMLITVDPRIIRSWSCCRAPNPDPTSDLSELAEIPGGSFDPSTKNGAQVHIAHALSWLSLATGDFFRRPIAAPYFDHKTAADTLLLENLREVRKQLHEGTDDRPPLDYATIHALLARVMFLQFLADRKDVDGNAALNTDFLEQRHQDGTLANSYSTFAEVLSRKTDLYRLFRWLNDKFNGDLFPTEAEERVEERSVASRHLQFLAAFIRGDVQLRRGQRFFWRQYSFDVIPLEFISSIYEEFVRSSDIDPGKGVVYTPAHLVDFILDGVLPWDGPWDVKILDPACGSGIFLVKAYQRLIHRWKLANPDQRPSAGVLRQILERCLYGVDTQEDAIRVASFSLYLAMCDEIDPKRYWTHVRFPRLRGNTINHHDFFDDGPTVAENGQLREFDLVVGNPPWGREEDISSAVSQWIDREAANRGDDERSWRASFMSIGPLFLPRAAEMLKPDGCVSLMQSSAVLLNEVGTARELRARLFTEFVIEEVVNLAPLRYILFSTASHATSPPAIITMRRPSETRDGGGEFVYMVPKPARTVEDDYRLLIGPHDVHAVYAKEVLSDRNALTTLIWGTRRDLALLGKLTSLPTLQQKKTDRQVTTRRGVNRGNRKRIQPVIVGRKMLEATNFPESAFLTLDPRTLPTNTDGETDAAASTDFAAFDPPQLLIKLGWMRENLRFRAVRIFPPERRGAICSRSYVSVRANADNEKDLDAACLVYNSTFALYWLFLTNHRLASFIAEATVSDLLQVPLPPKIEGRAELADVRDFNDVDKRVRLALGLQDADWVLISDFFTYTLPDFKRLPNSPGSHPTRRDATGELSTYCEHVIQVLEAAFGKTERFSATIFKEDGTDRVAARMVAIHLDQFGAERVRHEAIALPALFQRLEELEARTREKTTDGIAFQRFARVYGDYRIGRRRIPTLFIIKPDQVKYWTGSAGMRDGDEAFNEIMLWQESDGGSVATQEKG